MAQTLKLVPHEQSPGKIYGILFSYTLALVALRKARVFLHQLRVGHANVVHIMNESGKDAGKLGQWIGSNSKG